MDDEFLHLPGGAPARPPPARSVSLSGWAGSQFTARLMGETRQDRVGRGTFASVALRAYIHTKILFLSEI